jgi:hypothetical protein
MPAVFSGVFVSGTVDEVGAAINALEAVKLEDESELLFQAVHTGG